MALAIQQENYQYERLPLRDGIRLLTLMPGKSDDELVFSLRNTGLNNRDGAHNRYEALSYTWGDPTPRCSALCSDSYLPLATSLHTALLSLRYLDDTRTLWIDAICINQNDLEERASQVSIMQQIYNEADRVVIWLGTEDDLTSTAIKTIERLYSIVQAATRSTVTKAISGAPVSQVSISTEELRNNHQITALEGVALARFFQKPWFKRAWVVQEVASAKRATVVCGPLSIEWDRLARVCQSDVLQTASRVSASMIRAAPGIMSVRREQKLRKADNTAALLSLLSSTRGLDATDPRDKLFAIQHLARVMDPRPVVDYTTPVAVVYARYAIQCLRTNVLDFLSAVDPSGMQSPSSMSGLPSWVPDWSHKPDLTNCPGEHLPLIESCTHFQASGSSAIIYTLSKCCTILTLRGARVGQVQILGPSRWAITNTSDCGDDDGQPKNFTSAKEYALKFEQFHSLQWLPHEEESERLRTLLDVLLCDTDAIGKRIFPRRLKPPKTFVEAMLTGKVGTKSQLPHLPAFMQQPIYPSPLISRIRIMSWGRRFCISDCGYYGWVPQHAQAGDVIVCFKGARVLMLLRQRTDGGWTLVGECYLHELMHGELLQMPELEWDDFVLK